MSEIGERHGAARAAVLLSAGVATGVIAVAVTMNPWRFVVLETRWVLTAYAVAPTLLLWAARSLDRRSWPRSVLEFVAWISTVAGVLILLLALFGSMFSFSSTLRTRTLVLDRSHRVVIIDVQYGLGPDAACRQLQLRWGNGLTERFRLIGNCAQLKYVDRWTYTADRDSFQIDTGTGTCKYVVSAYGVLTASSDESCRNLVGDISPASVSSSTNCAECAASGAEFPSTA